MHTARECEQFLQCAGNFTQISESSVTKKKREREIVTLPPVVQHLCVLEQWVLMQWDCPLVGGGCASWCCSRRIPLQEDSPVGTPQGVLEQRVLEQGDQQPPVMEGPVLDRAGLVEYPGCPQCQQLCPGGLYRLHTKGLYTNRC